MDRMKTTAGKRNKPAREILAGALFMAAMLLSACSNTVDLRKEIETELKSANGRFLEVQSIVVPLSGGLFNPTSTIEIKFDRPVDLATVTPETLIVRTNGPVPVDWSLEGVSYNESANTVRFRFLPFFQANADISLTVSGIKGRDGSVMNGEVATTFTTSNTYTCSVNSLKAHDASSSSGYTKTNLVDFVIQASDDYQYFKFKISTDAGTTWSDFITSYINRPANNIYTMTGFDLDSLFAPDAAPEGTVNLRFQFFGSSTGSGQPAADGLTQDISIIYDATTPATPSIPDLAADDDSGKFNNDNITNKVSGLTFSGTADPGISIKLYNGPTLLGTTTANTGMWSFDLALAAGTYSITALATDLAGNTATSAPLALTIDTTAPAAPTFTSAITSTNRTPTWTWTSGGGGGGYSCKIGTAAVETAATASYTPATALADGTYTLYLFEKDLAGNQSLTTSRPITVNALPGTPVVVSTTPTLDNTPTWTWTTGGYGNGTFRYQVDVTTGTWMSAPAITYTPALALTDGYHTLYVQERDVGGEWSASGTKAIRISPGLPYNAQTAVSRTLTLQARAIVGAVKYSWYLGPVTPALKANTTTASYKYPTTLAANTAYSWYLITYDKNNVATRMPASGYFTFTTGSL